MEEKIVIGQDNSLVTNEIINEFGLGFGDVRFKKSEQENVFDFVGFIISDEKTLAVFPKKYYTNEQIFPTNASEVDPSYDVQLLFETIMKYEERTNSNIGVKHLGSDANYDSDYPFADFFSIYDYYKKYGIYKEYFEESVAGFKGKISWKDSISKSNKIISGGKLVHAPLYVKQKKEKQIFLTECMAFAIDYTIRRFPFFFSLPETGHWNGNMKYFENYDFVLTKLRSFKCEVFRDIHKKLLQNMISFFEQLEQNSHGGNIQIKTNFFNLIWEDMVSMYLNQYFEGVREEQASLEFSDLPTSRMRFEKRTFNVDESENGYSIEPDHYAELEGEKYIFDSKYYGEITGLNYKQLAYVELLKSAGSQGKTFCAMLLPGSEESRVHFAPADRFYIGKGEKIPIIEHYLNVNDIMKKYK